LGFGPADDRIVSPPPGSHRESLLNDIGSAECEQRCGYHENCSPYATRKRNSEMAAIDTSNPEMRWQVKQAISSATMPPDVWLSASAQRCPCAALQRRDRGHRSTCKTQQRDRSFGAKPCSAFVAQKPLRAQ
jgi:hypothetical protein